MFLVFSSGPLIRNKEENTGGKFMPKMINSEEVFLPASTVNRLIPEAGATVRLNVLLLLNTFFQ